MATWFKLDALTCLAMGLALSAMASRLSPWLDLPDTWIRGAGLLLLPCAALMGWATVKARGVRPSTFWSVAVMAGNALWLVASVLTVTWWFSPSLLGICFVLLQALVVLVLLGLEFHAWRQAV